MDEEDETPKEISPEDRAIQRRMLIFEVNSAYCFDALMVDGLIRFIENTYVGSVWQHPTFPQGFIRSWATHNKVDLTKYENKKLRPAS